MFIILACKKTRVNKHEKVGFGQTPPPLLELFPRFQVFFLTAFLTAFDNCRTGEHSILKYY